ncbi:MAG: SRPBCC family protein [Thermoleophilia bacterium]
MSIDCRVDVTVPASSADTWDRLAGVATWPGWNPSCEAADLEGDHFAPGTRMRLTLRHPAGRTFFTRPWVVAAERARHMAWEARALGVRARTDVELQDEQEGTRVLLSTQTRGVLAFSYRWAMRPTTQAQIYAVMLGGLAESFR